VAILFILFSCQQLELSYIWKTVHFWPTL